jgi:urocanate hydratase
VLRHADAGYSRAIEFAEQNGVVIPMQPQVRD